LLSLAPTPISKSILLVEDDAASRALYCSALESIGHSVVTAEDGFIALQHIESVRPQIIVLDMLLPRLSGRDLLRHLRANPETRHIPVVIITGSDVSHLSERAGIPVIQKPFALSVLVDAVDSALRRAAV
jgi:CheY-like chemotaxis protein